MKCFMTTQSLPPESSNFLLRDAIAEKQSGRRCAAFRTIPLRGILHVWSPRDIKLPFASSLKIPQLQKGLLNETLFVSLPLELLRKVACWRKVRIIIFVLSVFRMYLAVLLLLIFQQVLCVLQSLVQTRLMHN